MDEDPPWMGPALAVGYLVLAAGWVVVIIGLTSIGLSLYAAASNLALETMGPDQVLDLMGARGIAVLNGVQAIGMVALAVATWLAVAAAAGVRGGSRVPRVFGLSSSRGAGYAAALVGGLTVGLFPAWVAEQVRAALEHLGLPLELSSLDLVTRLLNSPDVIGRISMGIAVVLVAPICEELVFRGFLWDAIGRFSRPAVTWVVTSILFGVMHLDPVQGTAVFFTGLFLGWLRWWTRSVWPAVLGHFVNNALAAAVATSLTAESEIPVPFWLAGAGGLITCGVAGALWWATSREDS